MATKKKPVEAPVVADVEVEETYPSGPVPRPTEVVEETVSIPAGLTSIRAEAGDSYLTIAARYARPGRDTRDLANRISDANGGAPVRPGGKVFLPNG